MFLWAGMWRDRDAGIRIYNQHQSSISAKVEDFIYRVGDLIEYIVIGSRLNETGHLSACIEFCCDCLFYFYVLPIRGLEAIHRFGITPYLYHSKLYYLDVYVYGRGYQMVSRRYDIEIRRHVHYKATFVWTAAFMLIGMASFLGSYGFTNAATRGEAWWGAVDKTYHNAAAVITLGAAIGVTSVAISFLYNAISKLQDKVLGRGQLPGVSKDSPLFSAPFKPLTQLYALSAFAMIIYFTLNPGSYRDFAASNYADVSSVILASLTAGGIIGVVATAGQKALSLTHDLAARCAPRFFNFEKGSFLQPADWAALGIKGDEPNKLYKIIPDPTGEYPTDPDLKFVRAEQLRTYVQ